MTTLLPSYTLEGMVEEKGPASPTPEKSIEKETLPDIYEVQEAGIPDEKFQTSKWEIWSYYAYYIGNSGVGLFNFAPSQAQNLLDLAGWDPTGPPGTIPCGSGSCVLPFAGEIRSINSIILICNGISFAIQSVLFLIIGLYADYGEWRRWILIIFTAVALGVSFGWLGVESEDKWRVGLGLYIVGLIAYQGSLTFWTAAFPGLARDLPEMQESAKKLADGEITQEQHNMLDMLSRNRLSNVSFAVSSLGELVVLAVMVGILKALHSSSSTHQNTISFSVLVAFSGGVWLLLAIPWFLVEKRRPGMPLPTGTTYLTVGIKSLMFGLREAWRLRDTGLYLAFYLLMGDVLNTTVTVISILQNDLVAYSTLQLTYLLIVGIATQGAGIYLFWLVQKTFKISTKTMFCFVVFWIIMLTGWGFIGIWSKNFGFKNVWEIWLYQAFYGLLVCPWYSYSQTMISELVPKGKEFLFFALFSIIGKTSSFVGPFVSSAIIDDSGNANMPFAFLMGLGIASCGLLFFIDVERSKRDCREYLEREGERLER